MRPFNLLEVQLSWSRIIVYAGVRGGGEGKGSVAIFKHNCLKAKRSSRPVEILGFFGAVVISN